MLFSTNTAITVDREGVGLDRGLQILMDAGFPALDLSLFRYEYVMADDYKATAKRIKALADSRGVIFNQSHAPFGGGYDKYTTQTAPNLPRIFEFVGLIGVKNIVVHPLQRGRYYGQEEELFELNMRFYSGLAPYAKNAGVKIAIENMYHGHPVTGRIVDDTCADPRELVRYYDSLGDPDAFTICLDLGHVALCGREPERGIKTIGRERLGAIHAHDVDYVTDLHTVPGLSKLNWEAICRSLGEIDYVGEFTLEADNFLKRMDVEQFPAATRFMAEMARHYADKVDSYRKK